MNRAAYHFEREEPRQLDPYFGLAYENEYRKGLLHNQVLHPEHQFP